MHTKAASSAIAPDTQGWNFYTADRGLQDLLGLYLPAALYDHLKPHLKRLGHLAANELDDAARLADRHPPQLHHRDRFGEDRQWIEYHPAYRRLEQAAYSEFGIHAMSHREGVLGWPEKFPAVAKHAFTYLFNQAEFGLGCPVNVTDSTAHLLRLYADEGLKAKYLDKVTALDLDTLWQGGQYMTEKEGGSDVGSLTSVARREGNHWRIYGEKWFCSNADARLVMLLARPEGAGAGTRGLGLFAMPRYLDDGSLNKYRFVRLKEKLGTRSMASAEVVMEGALAHQLGSVESGFKQMAEMVNWSRLSNGVKSAALMRRAAHDAQSVMCGRVVFGVDLHEKPLAQRQMLKILLPAEQSLSLWMFTAQALDQAEGHGGVAPSQAAAAVLRLATPVLKYRATRDGRKVAGDAIDMRGGCGYIEDFVNPRILRDAHLGSVWEGTGNIVSLDVITRAIRRQGCHEAFSAALKVRLEETQGLKPAFVASLRHKLDKAVELAVAVAEAPELESRARQATTALYHAATAALMAWEGAAIHAARGDARRALWAALIDKLYLSERSPLAIDDTCWEEAVSARLLDPEPVGLTELDQLL